MGNWLVRATERFITESLARDWAAMHISVSDIDGIYIEHEAMED